MSPSNSKPAWQVFDRAANAAFPVLPAYTGRPVTLDEWDQVFGPCEAITDIGCIFGPQLIEAYPDARVILVKREFDSWYRSINEVFAALWGGPVANFIIEKMEPLTGSIAGLATRKMLLGLFQATSVDDMRVRARETYDRHYPAIKQLVPPDRLLEFDIKDGLGPLCEFLGRDVPSEWVGREDQFPHVHDAAALRKRVIELQIRNSKNAAMVLAPYAVAAAAVVGAWQFWKM